MTWKIEKRKLSTLKVWEQNPRTITDKNFKDLEKSLEEDGDWGIITIDADGTIISGNQRYNALKKQGVKETDVKFPDKKLTAVQRKRIALRANKTRGEFDTDILASWDEESLKDGWFTKKEINNIFGLYSDKVGKCKNCPIHCGGGEENEKS